MTQDADGSSVHRARSASTLRKDLRTGQSVWQSKRAPAIRTSRWRRNAAVDVLIIGAGISGSMIADALSEAGHRIAIVDRRAPFAGSTTASTALLQYEIDVPLTKLSLQIGEDNAERVWRRSRLSLDALRQRATTLGIEAGLVSRDSLYLEGNTLDATGLSREAAARRRAGLEATMLSARQVRRRFGISRAGILSFENLTADPRRLAAGFLRAALARGAHVFAPVEILAVEPSGASVHAHSDRGSIVAKHVVFATGYETIKGFSLKGASISSTWAIATKAQRGKLWPEQCLIWEASEPYLYMRTTPDGRVICGGEDEEFENEAHRDELLIGKTRKLEKMLGQMFPALDSRAEFAWCGSFGASETGMPMIGSVPRLRNCYAAMGFGGNGITFSMMAAQVIRGLIAGDGDRDADLVALS